MLNCGEKMMSENKLPLRECVRVLVIKGSLVCLCKQIAPDGTFTSYAFPGGGVEKGQIHEDAIKMECLEEVGLAVDNVHFLNVMDARRGQFFYGDRALKFGGNFDLYFMARYSQIDKSRYNSMNDKMEYEWVSITDAIDMIAHGPDCEFNEARIRALGMAYMRVNSGVYLL
jgi:8-oxo-dGTP pyrophosphatase MutT (NUDIX family)